MTLLSRKRSAFSKRQRTQKKKTVVIRSIERGYASRRNGGKRRKPARLTICNGRSRNELRRRHDIRSYGDKRTWRRFGTSLEPSSFCGRWLWSEQAYTYKRTSQR